MLLSTSHRFIFIHVPKTAGTSITRALAPFCVNPDFSPMRAIRRSVPVRQSPESAWFQLHDTASYVRRKLGDREFARYRSFAVVRNPFDHAWSHYRFLKGYRHRHIARRVGGMDFLAYLNWRLSARHHRLKTRVGLFAKLPDQCHFLSDARGGLIVGDVLKFENLDAELAVLAARFGLELPVLGRHRQGPEAPGHAPEMHRFSAPEIAAIHRLYHRDFERFGYARTPFEPPAPEGA